MPSHGRRITPGAGSLAAWCCGTILILVTTPAQAQDWPQWRGPSRSGVATAAPELAVWPTALKPAWKVVVGAGHASPIVAGGRVYVFSRDGEDETLTAFDLATGQRRWRQAYAAPYTLNPAASGHGKGPKSTPALVDGRLYTFGIGGVLSCWDATNGKPVWRHDFAGRFKATSPGYGTAMSPLVEGGLVIAHVGGDGDGALTAFDAATGAERWAWKGDGPGYASPLLADIGGVRQVITQTQRHIVALSFARGELLWKIPFATEYEQNAVTPVVQGDRVVFSGMDKGTQAVKVAKLGASWVVEKAWDNPDVSMYMSSPVLDGGLLFGLSHRRKGQLFCLDAATGRTLWLGEGRTGENAALVAAGNLLFVLTTDSELIVARKDPKAFAPLRTYTVARSPTWAHPVVTARGILVKDADSLAFWSVE